MQQINSQTVDLYVRYQHSDGLVRTGSVEESLSDVMERAGLFVLVCAFWGLIVFLALANAL